jgi:IS1 family transposase
VVLCQKKEARLSALEKLEAIYGDQWVWIGFDPRHKIVVNFVVGRHTQANADKLVRGIKQRVDGHIPFFTSDELKHYDDALLKAYGIKHEFPRTGKPGRPRKSIVIAPKDLLYAQVVKHRQHGRVVEINTRVVFGTKKAVKAKLKQSPVSRHINTSFVERNNLTLRHHNRRLARKTISFSKKRECLEQQLHLAFAYYHFIKPHLGLRQEIIEKNKKYQNRTPAMAAGLTDHIWTMPELFSTAVFKHILDSQ